MQTAPQHSKWFPFTSPYAWTPTASEHMSMASISKHKIIFYSIITATQEENLINLNSHITFAHTHARTDAEREKHRGILKRHIILSCPRSIHCDASTFVTFHIHFVYWYRITDHLIIYNFCVKWIFKDRGFELHRFTSPKIDSSHWAWMLSVWTVKTFWTVSIKYT